MRSTPVARRGFQPGTQEFRVRFSRKLRGAKIVRESDLTPVLVPTPNPPLPQPAPQTPSPAIAVTPTTPTAPTDFWTTDVGAELQADRERIETALAAMQQTATELRSKHEERIAELQRAAVEFGVIIASQVIRKQMEIGEFPIETRLREIISQLSESEPVTIRLNPADLKLLSDRLDGEPLASDRSDLKVQADSNLSRGECQVDSREGMLLSDVTTEIQDMREELLRRVKNARS